MKFAAESFCAYFFLSFFQCECNLKENAWKFFQNIILFAEIETKKQNFQRHRRLILLRATLHHTQTKKKIERFASSFQTIGQNEGKKNNKLL